MIGKQEKVVLQMIMQVGAWPYIGMPIYISQYGDASISKIQPKYIGNICS